MPKVTRKKLMPWAVWLLVMLLAMLASLLLIAAFITVQTLLVLAKAGVYLATLAEAVCYRIHDLKTTVVDRIRDYLNPAIDESDPAAAAQRAAERLRGRNAI